MGYRTNDGGEEYTQSNRLEQKWELLTAIGDKLVWSYCVGVVTVWVWSYSSVLNELGSILEVPSNVLH